MVFAGAFVSMPRRIVILGGPHTGKTILSKRLKTECGISNVRHSDDIKHLGWSESSAAASEWLNEQGEWVAEGVQMARALRKWLAANPDTPLDIDIITLSKPFDALLKGQESMAKGVFTVFSEIRSELIERGARIHKLKDPDDAVKLFSLGGSMGEENEEGKEKENGKEVAGLKKRLDKHQGDAMALAAELSAENADLNRQLAAAKGQKPKEGSLLLSPDQAKQWEAFIALGKPDEVIAAYQEYTALGKAEELKTKITAYGELETKVSTLEKVEQLRKVADGGINGKKLKISVLETLDKNAGGLTYEEKDISVTENGKTTTEKVWHVKDVKQNGKWVPLSEYSETHWKDFGPALTAEETAGPGTRVVGQVADDKNAPKPNKFDKIRKDAEERQKKVQQDSVPLEKRLGQVA